MTLTATPTGTSVALTWTSGAFNIVSRNGVPVQMLKGGTWTDKGLSPGIYEYAVASPGTYQGPVSAVIASPPPPVGPIWGAYSDDDPSGTDDGTNLANLVACLNALAPAGKTVKMSLINTYSGNPAGFQPLNGVKPPAGTTVVVSLGLGSGIAPGTTTMLEQVTAMVAEYKAIAETLLGWGTKAIWRFYELNGNWQASGVYPPTTNLPGQAGVGWWVLYPAADVNASIAYLAAMFKGVDPTCLIDCNFNGNGPNGHLDQLGGPAIDRVPMAATDIISVDTGVGEYGVAHATPWISLAQANGKKWAIPELTPVESPVSTADINALVNLANGTGVYEPAYYVALFSSDDDGPEALTDPGNGQAATAWAAALAD